MSTVLIGHASISEKGTVNGAKGDSTKKEVCTRPWYSKPWDFMAIHPDATVREKHAKAVEDACANNYIGYGQSNRNTANTEAKKVNYNISKIKTKCNTDCSALQNLAAVASGAKGVTYGTNGWTTSTMKSALQSAGYKIITNSTYLKSADYCVRGAIYVKSGSHTVCGLTNGSKASQTLSKVGLASFGSSKTTAKTTANTSTKPTYKVGSTYTTQVELRVRIGAGTNCKVKTNAELSANAKANDKDKDGAIGKGTKVTCKAIKKVDNNIWMKIPSGWIAAYYEGNVYVK